jgi:hypothetical protein
MSASTLALMTAGLAAVVGLTAPAMAQCTNDPTGAIQDNDDQVCGNTTPDSNGGCNVSPVSFQSLGVLNSNSNYKLAGKAGTYGATGGSRDLDWYTFSVSTDCKIQFNGIINTPAQTSTIFVFEDDCDGDTLAAVEFAGCNSVPADFDGIYCEAGKTYIFVITTPFEPDTTPGNDLHTCASYVVDIVTADGDSGCSGVPNTARCDKAHGGTGCEDWSCCNQVCFADPLCCVLEWTSSCATAALGTCTNYLYYECLPGGPSNDCIAGATELEIDAAPVNFDTTNAGADAWLVDNCQTVPFTRDVWAKVTAPSSGNLFTTIAGTGLSGTLEFYNLGSDPLTDPQEQLPDAYVGCLNITGTGGTVVVNGLVADDTVYIRYAHSGAPQQFTLAETFDFVIFNTGGMNSVIFNGTLTNLGYSSGDLAGAPQRWMAVPFNVPAAPAAGDNNAWAATAIVGKGFIPAGTTTTLLRYTVWNRTNFDEPLDGDQVSSGEVPMPTPFDEAEDTAANAAHQINLAEPLTLCPGDYYLTIYGADPTPDGEAFSNWAWFTGAQNGIFMTDGSGPFGRRSVTFPEPGLEKYTTPAVVVPAGLDPNSGYSCAFRVVGNPTESKACETKTPCVGDLTGDGQVDGADLGTLLGGWGTPGTDLTGDGNTDGADLGTLLGAWGPCP